MDVLQFLVDRLNQVLLLLGRASGLVLFNERLLCVIDGILSFLFTRRKFWLKVLILFKMNFLDVSDFGHGYLNVFGHFLGLSLLLGSERLCDKFFQQDQSEILLLSAQFEILNLLGQEVTDFGDKIRVNRHQLDQVFDALLGMAFDHLSDYIVDVLLTNAFAA